MALTGVVYGGAATGLGNAAADLDAAGTTLKVALLTSAYTPNIDTDEFWADISANEASGTGYTAGGLAVSNKAGAYDSANDRWELDFDDPAWDPITVTFRYAVLYIDTGTPATSRLLCYWTDGSDKSPSAGPLTLQINAEGAFHINVA